tara:strand:- start:4038 stop:4937 length:900 start_codon:yes stop_codon:yes gene_type:complete
VQIGKFILNHLLSVLRGDVNWSGRMKAYLFVALLVLAAPFVSGEARLLDIEILVDGSGTAKVMGAVYIDTSVLKEVSLETYSHSSIDVYDIEGDLNFREEGERLIVIPRENEEGYSFNFQYVSNELTFKNGEVWRVGYALNSDAKARTVSFVFSEDMELHSNEGSVFDLFGKKRVGFYSNSPVYVDYNYSGDFEYEDESHTWVIVGVLIGLIVFGFFLFNRKLKKGKRNVVSTLNEPQQKIVRVLMENKGKLTQSKLRVETGLPKATLSRNLKYLEFRKLVEVNSVGQSNMVELKDWMK